jgi:pimeloyl-ACP methyl ester carboxylesterase
MTWGGIDTWKEEMRSRAAYLLDLGFAMLLVDMPGIGQSPVRAGRDAERQWTPIFDWLDRQHDLDGTRVATLGASYGGYWAMKLAYTHRDRLRAAVNWGGGVHITFTPERQEKSRNAASYLMDLDGARAALFDGTTFEDCRSLPRALTLDQGLLDSPRLRPPRQRPQRPAERDRRHLPEPRARRPEDGADLPGRAHGRGPDGADDRRLARRAPGLSERALRRRPAEPAVAEQERAGDMA